MHFLFRKRLASGFSKEKIKDQAQNRFKRFYTKQLVSDKMIFRILVLHFLLSVSRQKHENLSIFLSLFSSIPLPPFLLPQSLRPSPMTLISHAPVFIPRLPPSYYSSFCLF